MLTFVLFSFDFFQQPDNPLILAVYEVIHKKSEIVYDFIQGCLWKTIFCKSSIFQRFLLSRHNFKPFYPQAVRFIRRPVDKFTKPCIIGLLRGFFAANTNVCSYVKFLRFVLDSLFFLNYANPPDWREIHTLR